MKTSKPPSKWKAIKVVILTSGSFVVCWMPYFIAATTYAIKCADQIHTESQSCLNLKIAIASPLAILGFLNSLFNPIIYAWWHNGFRESIKKTYRYIFKKENDDLPSVTRQQPTQTTGTSSTSINTSGRNDNESSDTETRLPSVRPAARITPSMSPDPTEKSTQPLKLVSNQNSISSTTSLVDKRISVVNNINLDILNNPYQKEHNK